jgi:hypothetical protein
MVVVVVEQSHLVFQRRVCGQDAAHRSEVDAEGQGNLQGLQARREAVYRQVTRVNDSARKAIW